MALLAFGLAWMAGLVPAVARISPATTPLSLVFPFALSGVGIGLAVAPVTSAVMATAPRDRVGNASGVLSTMRQIGSLLGIAVLGAVLDNRVTANVTKGIAAVPGLPAAIRDKVIAGVAHGGLQSSAGAGGGSRLPAPLAALLGHLFREWFTRAVASAFVVAVALACAGALCALLLRSHVAAAAPTTTPDEAEPSRG
jgi:hypothetical protein